MIADSAKQTSKRKVYMIMLALVIPVVIMIFISSKSLDTNQNPAVQDANNSQAFAVTTMAISNVVPEEKEQCGPPCWQGIVPGKSTEDQVQKLVAQFAGHELVEGLDPNTGKRVAVHSWRSGHLDQAYAWNSIRSVGGIVERIDLFFNPANSTLVDLIDKYGPPQKLRTERYGTEVNLFHIGFLYPSKGLEFWTEFSADVEPRRDAKVRSYSYYVPMRWEAYLS